MALGGNKRFRETQMGGAPRIPLAPPLFVSGVGFSGLGSKSPRGFDGGAVGLRIVAAMSSGGGGDSIEPGSGPKPVEDQKPKRSDPIPIRGRVGPTVGFEEEEETEGEGDEEEKEEDDVELSESYTCVISHVGGGAVRKRVYVGGGDDDDDDGIGGKFGVNSGVFFDSPPVAAVGPIPGDFLTSCYLCRKKLHGLDIFMYRGEAFCSVDCRCQQILNDDYKEKCWSGAAKARESFVLLPYRASLIFDAGVVAA